MKINQICDAASAECNNNFKTIVIYSQNACPYCNENPCTCYRVEERERMNDFVVVSWDEVWEW